MDQGERTGSRGRPAPSSARDAGREFYFAVGASEGDSGPFSVPVKLNLGSLRSDWGMHGPILICASAPGPMTRPQAHSCRSARCYLTTRQSITASTSTVAIDEILTPTNISSEDA